MTEVVDSLTHLEKLEARKTELVNELASMVDKRGEAREAFEKREASEDAKPSDEDRSAEIVAEEEFAKQFDERERQVESLERRIREQQIVEERRKAAAQAAGPRVERQREPLTYREDNAHEISYFRDLAAKYHATFASRCDDYSGAMDRLERHGKEMNDIIPERENERRRKAEQQIERAEREFTGSVAGARQRRGFDSSPFEYRVNPNRTDGQGGYFVPPLWEVDQYIKYLRAGRVGADLARGMDLPAGTDSINIPKLSTSTLTGPQTADNAPVVSQDLADTSVTANVKTIAGQEDVAIQLLEQSPGQIMDQVIMEDLLADLNKQIDVQFLLGTGNNGQITGLLPIANWNSTGSATNTVTWTSSTPSALGFNQAVGAAVSKTAYTRYSLENVHALLHPRRWFWFATSPDTTGQGTPTNGRPIVNADGFGPYNVDALEVNPTPYQGLVGRFPFGLPAHIDGNLPNVATTGGAISGGTADLGLVAKFDDVWLFEGALRTRVLPEILSGTLQVRFQVFQYIALLVRYGQSLCVIQGTGMGAPTGYVDSSITSNDPLAEKENSQMADLVGGRYPQYNAAWSIFGQATNVAQSDVPARTNLEVLGGLNTAIATGTGATTGVGNAVMVPVDVNTVISAVTIYVTATAASTPTHQFAALYQGTGSAPKLIGQSTDGTTAPIAANAPYTFTLASPQLITSTNCPNGFIYVSFSFTASAQPSFVTVAGPTIGAWGTMVPPTAAPLFFSATHGTTLAGTAATTIASPSNVTNAPVVLLT